MRDFVQPGATVTLPPLRGAPSGLVGQLTVRLERQADGTIALAESTADIAERPRAQGVSDYYATRVAPAVEGVFDVVWRNPVPAPDVEVSGDEVEVTYTAPAAPAVPTGTAYAGWADVVDYCADNDTITLPTDPAAQQRLIARAEVDVDGLLGALPILANGRKYDPTLADPAAPALEPEQIDALRAATCAQVEYRITMGPDFFVKPQHDQVSGPDYSTRGKLPYIGPKVIDELNGTGLQQPWARATVGPFPLRRRGTPLI